MAWYRTSTINLTNGSASVVGVGTDFIGGTAVGEGLQAPDGKVYEILSIQSATALTLGSVYLGATASAQTYSIVPTQSYIRDLASQAATLVNNFASVRDNAGTGKFDKGTLALPGVSFVGDSSTGIRHTTAVADGTGALAAGSFALVASGVDQATVDATGFIARILRLRNTAGTIISAFTSAATAARNWTFPDKDGTVAMLSDFAAPGAIGGTTPAAGSFTTLSATGTASAANFATPSVGASVGTDSFSTTVQIFGSAGGANANTIRTLIAGTIATSTSASGLAVTGALSATGNVSIVKSAGADVAYTFDVNSVAGGAVGFNNTSSVNVYGASTNTAYLGVAQNYPVVITTNGQERARITSAGLAVTGALSATGAITGATPRTYTAGEFTGGLNVFDNSAMTAGVGGTVTFSADSNGAGPKQYAAIGGAKRNSTNTDLAGDLVLYARGAGQNLAEYARLKADTGLAVTGALSATGAFSSRGITDNATATALTITSGGNGALGIATPYNTTTDVFTVSKNQNSVVQMVIDNQNTGASAFSGLSLSASGGSWNLQVPQSSTFVNPLLFKFGATEVARMSSAGLAVTGALSSTIPSKFQSAVIGYSWASSSSLAQFKIATLPISSQGSNDTISISGVCGGWIATTKFKFALHATNRGGLEVIYTLGPAANTSGAGIDFYTEADGSVSVWARLEGTYRTLACSIDAALNIATYTNPVADTPTGTLSFRTVASSAITSITSTGLAVTGALSTTGRTLLGTTTDDGVNQLQVNGPAKISGALSTTGTVTANGSVAFAATGALGPTFSWVGSDGGGGTFLNAPTTKIVSIAISNTPVGSFSSTGLAVTGTLSASSELKVSGANQINAAARVVLSYEGSGTSYIQPYGVDNATPGVLVVRPQSANGSVGNEVATFSSSRLAVTGSISATAPLGTSGQVSTNSTSYVAGAITGIDFTVAGSSLQGYVRGVVENGTTAATQLQFGVSTGGNNAATALTLSSSGNLGLGVTPSAWYSAIKVLQLGSVGGAFVSGNTSAGGSAAIGLNTYFDTGAATPRYGATAPASYYGQANGAHNWYTAPSGTAGNPITFTQAMTLDASGNLIVGGSTATGTPANGLSMINASSATQLGIGHTTGTGNGTGYLLFSYAAGLIGSITQSGTTAVLYNTTSDARLKENITDASDAASLIDALQVRQFDWKSDGSHQRYGMVAQELYKVAPEAVSKPQDPEEMMAVDYSKLVPMMLKELQSLRARVAQLEGI